MWLRNVYTTGADVVVRETGRRQGALQPAEQCVARPFFVTDLSLFQLTCLKFSLVSCILVFKGFPPNIFVSVRVHVCSVHDKLDMSAVIY